MGLEGDLKGDLNGGIAAKRKENPGLPGFVRTGLYHSIRLPDGRLLEGAMSIALQEERLASFRLPDRMDGMRVLDIGPWDGYFSFEMERRGAEVVAIDYVDLDTFRMLHRALGSRVQYQRLDVYELDPRVHGTFDVVLCLGVLYHLKHPLLALEKICAVTRDVCIIDSFVVDGEAWNEGVRPPIPYVEFYERDELGGMLDNWSGPTVGAIEAYARAAGFAETEVLQVGDRARVAAYRKWRNVAVDAPAITLTGLHSHANRGRCFESHKEDYLVLWCPWTHPGAPACDEVFPEIDGYGVSAMHCRIASGNLIVSIRIPPGLAPGRHEARIAAKGTGWSEACEFFVDIPPIENPIELLSVQDGMHWTDGQADWSQGGWVTAWVDGLSPEADAGNTIVEVDGIPHATYGVDVERKQVNFQLRPLILAGEHTLRVLHRGGVTGSLSLLVTGEAPKVQGLEAL